MRRLAYLGVSDFAVAAAVSAMIERDAALRIASTDVVAVNVDPQAPPKPELTRQQRRHAERRARKAARRNRK